MKLNHHQLVFMKPLFHAKGAGVKHRDLPFCDSYQDYARQQCRKAGLAEYNKYWCATPLGMEVTAKALAEQ